MVVVEISQLVAVKMMAKDQAEFATLRRAAVHWQYEGPAAIGLRALAEHSCCYLLSCCCILSEAAL